jgi:fatty acid desaturase
MHPVFNLCTGNLGYHTAHHVKPGLHWSRLPEYHATIAHKIPAHLYLKAGFPWTLFPVKEASSQTLAVSPTAIEESKD